MKEEAKYSLDGVNYLTLSALKKAVHDHSQTLPLESRQAFLDSFKATFAIGDKSENRRDLLSSIIFPTIGACGLIFLVLASLLFPFPTKFQSGVYWLGLSAFTALCLALIPGFFEFKHSTTIRATGGFAVFLFIYLYKPIIFTERFSKSQDYKTTIYIARVDTLRIEQLDINVNSTKDSIIKFIPSAIRSYFGNPQFAIDTFVCYRKEDGFIYTTETCEEISGKEIIVISNPIIRLFPNQRLAFLKIKTLIQ